MTDREAEIMRNIAKAAKSVRNQWLSTMDSPIPVSEPLQRLFSAVIELEEYEKGVKTHD